jgi:hypothetical protein
MVQSLDKAIKQISEDAYLRVEKFEYKVFNSEQGSFLLENLFYFCGASLMSGLFCNVNNYLDFYKKAMTVAKYYTYCLSGHPNLIYITAETQRNLESFLESYGFEKMYSFVNKNSKNLCTFWIYNITPENYNV